MSRPENDQFIAALAREIRDGDRMYIGTNQPDVAVAAYVARRLWAPGLKLWSAGQPAVDRSRDDLLVGLPTLDHRAAGHRATFFWQARAFDEMGRRPAICFAGGLQVDGRGNANMAGVRGDDGWALRGPGSAGMPSLTAWAPRFYIALPRHDPRFLVDRCTAISVVGDPATRRELGMNPAAPAGVITPLATFAPSADGLVLTETVDGISVPDLQERTGFTLRTVDEVRTRTPLSAEESAAIAAVRRAASRNRVDPTDRRPA